MDLRKNHMNEGNGDGSYARNSLLQDISIRNAIPVIQEALEDFYSTTVPNCIMVAELGCGVGPNSLKLVPEVMKITHNVFKDKKLKPEIHVFLNDLPGNDFNTISKGLYDFYHDVEEEYKEKCGKCCISFTPRSYHGRIFPVESIHFIHCANSAHWLSEIPEGLLNENGEFLNKGNICISENSSEVVVKAYKNQFMKGFTSILRSRADELIGGGRMIINMMVSNDSCQDIWILNYLNKTIKSMFHDGLIEESVLDKIEIPVYAPSGEEMKKLIEAEGSFILHNHSFFDLEWDIPTLDVQPEIDLFDRAIFVTKTVRVGIEFMFLFYIGDETLVNNLFDRFAKLVAQQLAVGQLRTHHQIVSLIKL